MVTAAARNMLIVATVVIMITTVAAAAARTYTIAAGTAFTASGPKTVKLFTNLQALDFDDAESQAPVQVLSLTPEQLATGEPVPLKSVVAPHALA